MTTLIPVSRSRHATMRWRRSSSYAFAADRNIVPLVGAELAQAAQALPIAFVTEGSAVIPVAVLALEPNRNLFVTQDGRWLGSYVPAALRAYPFGLLRTAEDRQLLAVDEASGLVGSWDDGESLMSEDGTLSASVGQVSDFLVQMERSRAATGRACAALQSAGLIERWPLVVKGRDGEREVSGLHRINESAISSLDDATFLSLRMPGALAIAYAQLLSLHNLQMLGRLAGVHAQATQQAERPDVELGKDLDLSWMNSDVLKLR